MYRLFGKRCLDVTLSLLGIIILSPVFIAVAIALLLSSDTGVFFIQQRSGKNLKPFGIIKFQSMNERCDEKGELLPDAQRMTRIGNFLRMTSIDEIPQLINVLAGQMSLVGPRPTLGRYLTGPVYEKSRRSSVRPGITGLAQINGRTSISYEERFAYDGYYIRNLSFTNDLKILYRTVLVVLKKEGMENAVVSGIAVNEEEVLPDRTLSGNEQHPLR